ncbi:DUF3153 domain-containing protein [Cylindrospermum sp. FACHB-282]|uniref:DUF3153 domain-containing protein n=1 Tax=Cylindrospermum sp. FACHB-282 TaxID=2692794 RepID=UPI001686FC36|nr:DUF3153 domain-containing protein [Cylindrospermum sp. FACHB-282]MBD2385605.1 DUF3153 domain-containing protein [Cylindrospermum sp. FACHB-282]
MNTSIFGKILAWLIRPFAVVLGKIVTGQKQSGAKTPKPILLLVLSASLLLSGCVEYDLGVNFNNANSGELVQHIKLAEKLTSFSGDYVYDWLNSIERRARNLDGKTQRVSPEEIIVKIPFTNGQELQEKFNQFFNSRNPQNSKSSPGESDSELPKIASNLLLEQNHFLLLVRNRLIYDLDLRSLSVIASKGNVLANAGSILDLEFSLKTPWGARNIKQTEDAIQPEKNGQQLVWKLKSGELNHLEVVFWLPSPIGIGAVFIILFVWGGIYLRYTFMPDPRIQFAPKQS